MSWLGAGIGAGIGFAVGGPIGAGIGLWLGSLISRDSSTYQGATLEQKNQTLFFVSLFSMLAKMAKADGKVAQSEINTVTRFMDNLQLDAEDKQAAIKIFRNAKADQSYTIYDYAEQYREVSNDEMRRMLYSILWAVAHSDGVIHPEENDILKKIPHCLGLGANIYNEFNTQGFEENKTSTHLEAYYEILGCPTNASDSEIKTCYKRSIAKYHPDKIQSKGLPKEFVKFANEQAKKINEAYAIIKESRK